MCKQEDVVKSPPVQSIRLSAEENGSFRKCFDVPQKKVKTLQLSNLIDTVILPKVRVLLGEPTLTYRKFKPNAVYTNRYYNDDWHIDRHGISMPNQKVNHSAVLYLDEASFQYYESGSNTLTVQEGTVIVFPSTLIHRASLSAKDTLRRSIVMFDIALPNPDYTRMVIKTPPQFHWPVWQKLGFNPTPYALPRLLRNEIYGWRYLPNYLRTKKTPTLISWEITAEDVQPAEEHKIGTSIYPVQEKPQPVVMVNHTTLIVYLLALLDSYLFSWYYYGRDNRIRNTMKKTKTV